MRLAVPRSTVPPLPATNTSLGEPPRRRQAAGKRTAARSNSVHQSAESCPPPRRTHPLRKCPRHRAAGRWAEPAWGSRRCHRSAEPPPDRSKLPPQRHHWARQPIPHCRTCSPRPAGQTSIRGIESPRGTGLSRQSGRMLAGVGLRCNGRLRPPEARSATIGAVQSKLTLRSATG